jgi:hypothetical protein
VDPQKWVIRILQEQPLESFRACAGGIFERNLIVHDERVRVLVNVGPNTEPESFEFRRNAWFCRDGRPRLTLPVDEEGAVGGVDPELREAEDGSFRITSRDRRLRGIGAGRASR